MNKVIIFIFQRAFEEGLIPETYWLYNAHDILKTNYNIPNDTEENIKHMSLWIGMCPKGIPNKSIKRQSMNDTE
jgi:hypothetical protein